MVPPNDIDDGEKVTVHMGAVAVANTAIDKDSFSSNPDRPAKITRDTITSQSITINDIINYI